MKNPELLHWPMLSRTSENAKAADSVSIAAQEAERLCKEREILLASLAHDISPELLTAIGAKLAYESRSFHSLVQDADAKRHLNEERRKKLPSEYFTQGHLDQNFI